MKKIFLFFCLLVGLSSAYAQCPQYLTFDTSVCNGSGINKTIDARVLTSRLCGDSVKIVFNDSLTALNGSRQVYFHAGPEFRPFTGWQGAYTGDAAMTKTGAHTWSIKINPRNFFNYSPDSCLNSIACGFRDSAYVNYVKDGSNDIFILTYTGAATTAYPYVTCTYTHNTAASYLWNDGHTDSVRVFTTGGNYTVTATGVGGCTATGTVHIHVGNSQVSLGNDTVYCTSGYVLVPHPSTFASYRWGNGTTSSTYIGFNPGRIWVQATDSAGCTSYDTVTVHYSQTWGLKLGDTLTSCSGAPVSKDASIHINLDGDSLVIIYDATQGQTQLATDTNVYFHSGPEFRAFSGWQGAYTVGHYGLNDGVGRMTPLPNHQWRIAIDPQAYYGYLPDSNLNGIFMIFRNFDGTKTGKDAGGNNIYIATNGIFPFHNLNVQPTCSFNGVVPSLTARKPLSYHWSNGATTAADTFTTSGVYRVTVTDGVCSRTDSVRVITSGSQSVNLGNDTCLGSGGTVTLNAGGGFASYVWSTGASTQTITANLPGTYWVRASSAGGCIGTDTIVVSTGVSVSLGRDTCLSGGSITLTPGAGFASYIWTTGATTPSISVSAAGAYGVTVTSLGGCSGHDSILVGSGASVSLGRDTCVPSSGSIVLNAGSGFTSYHWSTGASTASVTVSSAGIYAVTVSAGGCQARDSVTVTTCTSTPPSGCTPVAYFRVVNVSAGNSVSIKDSTFYGRHYHWSFGDGDTSDISGSIAHTYAYPGVYTVSLIVCDSCGCDTISKQVNVNVTGIYDVSGLTDVKLYPNPASTVCTIDISSADNMDVTVSLVDVVGAVLQSTKWQVHSGANKLDIDVANIASGIYEVTMSSGSGRITRKLNIIK